MLKKLVFERNKTISSVLLLCPLSVRNIILNPANMVDEKVTENAFKMILGEFEKEDSVKQAQSLLLQKFNLGENDLVTLGNVGVESSTHTVCSYLMLLFRKHGLHRNEREMLLSYEDMTVVIQLCLADINKQKYGSYEVEASSVLEMHRCLINNKLKLSPFSDAASDLYKELCTKYEEFKAQCNLLDVLDLLARIKEEKTVNESLSQQLSQTNYFVVNYTVNPVEQEMIRFLAGEKECYSVALECSLDDSLSDGGRLCVESIDLQDRLNGTHSRSLATPGGISDRSITEKHAEQVLMSYLQLLVNSRHELALAHVFNVPERELTEKAFTSLKHQARAKKVSMFQASMSHVMRVRLGGKSYVPGSTSPLSQYTKGLAELTDLVQKLVTIIEEDKDSGSAVRRVVAIVKNSVVKSKDCRLRRVSVEAITARLQAFAQSTLHSYTQHEEESPKRDAHHGGSLVGRRTLRVIRAIVDRYSARLPSNTGIDCLTDAFSSQSTPVRMPSLLSKFSSPLESSPDSRESQSLRDRMKAKYPKNSKKQNIPRFKSTMDWAMPLHDVGLNRENSMNAMLDDYIPSKTIVHPAEKSKSQSGGIQAKKVVESLHDQENAVDFCPSQASQKTSLTTKQTAQTDSSVGVSSHQSQTSKKRALNGASQLSQPAQKKAKKESKKKALPLQKGQKQLTSFFRL